MNNLTKETQLTLLYIFVAFTFSVLMRMIWIYQFSDYEMFKHAGEFMINTNDGYYWAEGARDILSGVSQENDLSPITKATSQLTALLAFILPFSFETIILYMPVYLSSLVVVPVILIARNLNNLEMGLIAALLSSIAWSYYNRTMVGYYDTDMLNIVLPMFLLWSIIWAIDVKENKYLVFTALDVLLYRWWYPESYSLEFAFVGFILVYTLLFNRKELFNYKLLIIMLLAMLNLEWFIQFPLLAGVLYLFQEEKFERYIYATLGLSIVLFFITGGFSPIWSKLSIYIFKETVSVAEKGLQLHFFSVMQTVREASQIPFETFANRISGHTVTFVFSLIGYVYLVYRYKIMIFALPLVGLGFLASVGGLRFTIYAVPILAMGVAFLITSLSSKIPNTFFKYIVMLVLTLAVLFPNYKHIDGYKVPTVMNANEVHVLDKLKSKAGREDYVIAWWDYGYPIRYYADVKTLGDGGKHTGSVNYPISFILTNPPEIAAKMARLDVEYTEKAFLLNKKNIDLNESQQVSLFTNIEEMTKDYGFSNTNDFIASLQTDMKLPNKTRDIYFYLPFQMLNIYPTVKLFSNMNLMNGRKGTRPFFFVSKNFQENEKTINLGSKVILDKTNSTLKLGEQIVPLKRVVQTAYDKSMNVQKSVNLINPNAQLTLIYMTAYKTFVILDEASYNSLFIQLMVLEEYDKSLFEQVFVNPHAKIYKLKI